LLSDATDSQTRKLDGKWNIYNFFA
jgi:hypothetical protein